MFSLQCSGAHRALHSFLHDALPILSEQEQREQREKNRSARGDHGRAHERARDQCISCDMGKCSPLPRGERVDRKSTRLNSSHVAISYAVFCLKKKKTNLMTNHM